MNPSGRIVIVIDDGLVTGAIMIAALHDLQKQKLADLICAVPVSPSGSLKKIAELADEIVYLESPEDFRTVTQYYPDFPQIEGKDVMKTLQSPKQLAQQNLYQSTYLN